MQSYSKKRQRNGTVAKNSKSLRILTVRQRPGHPAQGFINVERLVPYLNDRTVLRAVR